MWNDGRLPEFIRTEDNVPDVFADDIREELLDPDYITRQHYSKSTYALGCKGPLCLRRQTDYQREMKRLRAENGGRDYRPLMKKRNDSRFDEIEEAIVWHFSTHVNPMTGQNPEYIAPIYSKLA